MSNSSVGKENIIEKISRNTVVDFFDKK